MGKRSGFYLFLTFEGNLEKEIQLFREKRLNNKELRFFE